MLISSFTNHLSQMYKQYMGDGHTLVPSVSENILIRYGILNHSCCLPLSVAIVDLIILPFCSIWAFFLSFWSSLSLIFSNFTTKYNFCLLFCLSVYRFCLSSESLSSGQDIVYYYSVNYYFLAFFLLEIY